MKEQEEIAVQVAFNLSSLQIQEVFRLLQLADDYYLKREYTKVIHTLVATKLSVIQSLTKGERTKLSTREINIKRLLIKERIQSDLSEGYGAPRGMDYSMARSICKKIKGNLKQAVEEYKTELMDILEVHGYLIKHMEDFKKMF